MQNWKLKSRNGRASLLLTVTRNNYLGLSDSNWVVSLEELVKVVLAFTTLCLRQKFLLIILFCFWVRFTHLVLH